MDNMFLQIKDRVTQWVYNIKKAHSQIATNIILNSNEALRVFFENEKYIAELVVERGEFAPYRYVKMEILSLDSKYPTPIYIWYDSQNDSIEKILINLQIGLDLLNE